jgi:hypothetical protein
MLRETEGNTVQSPSIALVMISLPFATLANELSAAEK